ncbi:hypothetical protein [Bremerella sp. P1]|uniref:hypothetical protein n=1 Tax=Bremerella sp. P1 TaxID=3026424 RepID=UPI0023683AAE|nr:hypothetical protein [Bremerella sp. P1]WDI42617.1 hypothetical protein PSR63_01485 [Bremerella sp. P1]
MTSDQPADPLELLIVECDDPEKIIRAVNNLMPKMPSDLRVPISVLMLDIVGMHGKQGLYDRFNNRSIASLISEYRDQFDIRPIVEGERDGVKFQLFEDPNKRDQ